MGSVGRAQIEAFRVFSTLNAPGPLSMFLLAGLVLQFNAKGVVPILSSVLGVACLMLTSVRSAWIGLVVAAVVVIIRLRGGQRLRLAMVIAGAAIVGALAFSTGPFGASISENFQDRLETFENLADDRSVRARRGMYNESVRRILLTRPLGTGLGGSVFDSGFVTVLTNLGLIPGLALILSVMALGLSALRLPRAENDTFRSLALGTFAAFFVLMASGNQIQGLNGVILYCSVVLALAGGEHQRAIDHDGMYAAEANMLE
jgi:O-antigen ligase